MTNSKLTVGFSGHRNLSAPDSVSAALHRVLSDLKARSEAHGLKLELVTGIAFGADLLAVEAARDLRIPVHMVLPKPVVRAVDTGMEERERGFAEDFWDGSPGGGRRFRQEEWDRCLQQIDDARQGVNGGSLFCIPESRPAPECYQDTGLRVFESCDLLVAVWDGQPARGTGGTAEVVSLVRQAQKPLIVIEPLSAALKTERTSGLPVLKGMDAQGS